MSEKANILVVEVGPEDYDNVAPQLLQALFEVDRVPSAGSALELLNIVPFSAVICRHPFSQIETDDFIAAVKAPTSASRDAGIALVTDPDRVAEAGIFLDQGVDLVLSLGDPQGEREAMLCTLLGIQPRRSLRVLVKLSVEIEAGGTDRFVSQTHDVSGSGMFVITRKSVGVGSEIGFSFTLPGEPRPFEGVAEVTRIAEPYAPGPQGLGIHFEKFRDPNDDMRLQKRLDDITQA
ncbi:MAG: PilZ domain-containing protein [Acidobacteriota bacterium]